MSKIKEEERKKETFLEIKEYALRELKEVLGRVDEESVERFVEMVRNANKVFVIGVGRSMLILQAFAKRLNHLRINAYVVGETTVPPIGEKDLLVAASGSGETMTTVNISRLAKKKGAKIALITAREKSTLSQLADLYIKISCPTKLRLKGEYKSKQLMGSLFEQSLLLFFDCITIKVQRESGINEEEMWRLHANLE